VALAAFAPSARAAEPNYTFTGSGWGHGVGMSQYGARGGAEAGKTYPQILAQYYRGTTVGTVRLPSEIRVGLQQGPSEVRLSSDGRFDVKLSGQPIVSAGDQPNPDAEWIFRPTASGGYLVESPEGQSWIVGDPGKWLEVRFESFQTIINVSGIRYSRGWLEFNTFRNGYGNYVLRTILHVAPFDSYLYGIAEMPSSWHVEALKAQAVPARTYALEKMRTVGVIPKCNCHLYDDTRSQVYIGYEKEVGSLGARWRSAVQATAAKAVLSGGAVAKTLYHSSSGGYTEHNDNVWAGTPLSYLRGVADPWDKTRSPYLNWSVTFTKSQLQQRLASRPTTDVGTLQSITLVDPRGASGRVTRVFDANRGGVRLVGSKGTKRIGGDLLRAVLGLRSTLFKMTTSSS
jgi:SpoIID/LytB domain protein